MSNVIVIGSQWGDEGKGKIVDWLSYNADAVVRFQGGHNAGHTLVVNGITYKLSLLPSGVVRGKKSFIGNGVVLDLRALYNEIKSLEEKNIKITEEVLSISQGAPLIMSYHQELDKARESKLSGIKIGTTGRGIGPAYEDHVGRRSLRVCDLFNKNKLKDKIGNALSHHNPIRKGLGIPELDVLSIVAEIDEYSQFIKPFVKNIWVELLELQNKNKNILFEGAQGTLLDINHGTYPFVTSSNTVSAQASIGTGLGLIKNSFNLGITKSYLTRVGEGPFPTEQSNNIGEQLGTLGNEFGTVTGRKRRCGWLDLVLLKQSVIISGLKGLALTKLDVLDSFDKIKVCTSYKYNNKSYNYLPLDLDEINQLSTEYIELDGWKEKTRNKRDFSELPLNAKKYISFIEEFIGVPVTLLSTSPEREDTILFHNPFEN
ncbi:MAG: adenylosuccinate synthase [Alphaproteobacteria bacterium TMED93]|nr:MAG: adenylosuccinate synthase [Alphaproteobacteria bacterium TMED93]